MMKTMLHVRARAHARRCRLLRHGSISRRCRSARKSRSRGRTAAWSRARWPPATTRRWRSKWEPETLGPAQRGRRRAGGGRHAGSAAGDREVPRVHGAGGHDAGCSPGVGRRLGLEPRRGSRRGDAHQGGRRGRHRGHSGGQHRPRRGRVGRIRAGRSMAGRASRSGSVRSPSRGATSSTRSPPTSPGWRRRRRGRTPPRLPSRRAPARSSAGSVGGKKGAAIGAAIGGGGGTAVVLTTRGPQIRLPRGTAAVAAARTGRRGARADRHAVGAGDSRAI